MNRRQALTAAFIAVITPSIAMAVEAGAPALSEPLPTSWFMDMDGDKVLFIHGEMFVQSRIYPQYRKVENHAIHLVLANRKHPKAAHAIAIAFMTTAEPPTPVHRAVHYRDLVERGILFEQQF